MFFYQISTIRLRAFFYTLKTNQISVIFWGEWLQKRGESSHTPCVLHLLILFSQFGVFDCKENPLLLMFSKLVFNGFSWVINGLIHSFILISISHSIWVWVHTHFLLMWIQEEVGIELVANSKCAPKEEGRSWKWMY